MPRPSKSSFYEQQLKDALLENERLRELLGEQSNYPDTQFVYADVILKNVDSYSSYLHFKQRGKRRYRERYGGGSHLGAWLGE